LSDPARSEASSVLHERPDWVRAASRPLVLAAVVTVILISAIEGTIVATVMPQIVGQLGGFDLFSWVFTAYLLTQAVTIPIYGRLADIYGRKRMLLVSIGLFLIGSVACGFAWNMISLVAFRVVQGIGAGGLVPVAQTVFGDLYSPVERAKLQGYISSVWAIGSILGPLIGAFLVAHTIWPMVFWVNVPIGAAAAGMLILWLHEDVKHRQHRVDYGGAALMALGSFVLMFALVQAIHLSVAMFAALIALALVLLTLFVLHERRAPEPMLPIELLKNRIIAAGNLACFALGAIMMGATAFLSLYVQGVMGRSAIIAGIVLMTPSVTWPIGSASGGWIMLRTSYRATTLIGAAPLLLGSLAMIMLDPTRGPLLAAIGAALIGIGMGLTSNTFTVAIQSSVGWAQRGIVTSTISFTRQVGQAIGAAVFGGTINAELASQGASGDIVDRIMDPGLRSSLPADAIAPLTQAIAEGLHNVYLITGLLALGVLATALVLPRGLNPRRDVQRS
jgi:EmrB/QacA subfamily drug resistance transporter